MAKKTNDIDGIWFGGVNKNKTGNVFSTVRHCSKDDVAYSDHINRLMNSPPEKRTLNPPKWGGGIQPCFKPISIWSKHQGNLVSTFYSPYHG